MVVGAAAAITGWTFVTAVVSRRYQRRPSPAPSVVQGKRTTRDGLLRAGEKDWPLPERERTRQVQIHALEALAVRLAAEGHLPDAIQAAYVAIAGEPLSESAHAVLIDIFLGEGELARAWRHLESYRALLRAERDVGPSAALVGKLERARGGGP